MYANACLSNQLLRSTAFAGLSLTQTRILVLALRGIHKKKAIGGINIPVSEVLGQTSGAGYKMVRDALVGLEACEFEGQPILLDMALEGGLIQGRWNPDMFTHLQPTGEYTCVDFSSLSFKSAYSYRLYWLLKSYRNLKSIVELSIPELRDYLFANQTLYAAFANLRRTVLDVIVEDFKAAGLALSYELRHAGKKVAAVRWRMVWTAAPEAPVEAVNDEIDDAKEQQAELWIAAQSEALQLAYKRLQLNNRLSKHDARQVVKHVFRDASMVQRVHTVCKTINEYVAKCKRDGKPGVRNMNAFTIRCLLNEFPDLVF